MERSYLIKRAYFKLILASVIVVPYNENKFQSVEVPMEHRSPNETYRDGFKWQEKEYNYRLDFPVEEVFYAILDNKVVGHIGLDQKEAIKAVYVDKDHRGKGIAEKLHIELFKANDQVLSDEADAMELEIINLWEKLVNKMPNNVTKLKDGSYIYKA